VLALHEDQYTFMIISRSILPRMEVFQVEVVEETKIHFTFNNFFWKSCRLL